MNIPIIKVENLATRYGPKIVLENVNFAVQQGEIFIISGLSGCGKTTLLNNMIGLLETFSGNIIIDGDSIIKVSEQQRLAILRKIGVLYQGGALFGSINLLENVRLPLMELTKLPEEATTIIAHNKLQMVGLDNYAEYMPAEISGGMQKRTAIARAMVLDPKILFLDEPSAGLDPSTAAELDQIIINLTKTLGITFVIISHDLSSIYNIGDHVIFLHQGHIIAEGTPQDFSNHTNPLVKKFFNRKPI